MIKRERELNEIAARYGFGPGKRTSNGHLVFQHERTGRKVFASFSASNPRVAHKQFERDLRQVAGQG